MPPKALRASQLALAAAAGMLVLFANDHLTTKQSSSLVSDAQARVGRPLTAGSVAGVARRTGRRTTRRAVVGGAAVGAAATGAYYYGSRCYRNAYGHTVCP
jgi:hypothetical protein